jgi:hypothetical protein
MHRQEGTQQQEGAGYRPESEPDFDHVALPISCRQQPVCRNDPSLSRNWSNFTLQETVSRRRSGSARRPIAVGVKPAEPLPFRPFKLVLPLTIQQVRILGDGSKNNFNSQGRGLDNNVRHVQRAVELRISAE